jgi:hypothetical protein
LLLKKGGKFKKNEKWHTERQKLELVSEIRSEYGKHTGLETTENKEQNYWKLILTREIQIPNEKFIHEGTQVTEDL